MRTITQNPHAQFIQDKIKISCTKSFQQYHDMLGMNCPRELARLVLPVGTYSHMFAKTDLHNWFGFLRERLHEHAQYEIRVYAIEILKILETIAPVAVAAFKKQNGYT